MCLFKICFYLLDERVLCESSCPGKLELGVISNLPFTCATNLGHPAASALEQTGPQHSLGQNTLE